MLNKIMVATDGSKEAEKAVGYAIDLAKSCGAELSVVCVVDTGSPRTAIEIDPDYTKENAAYIDVESLETDRKKIESQVMAHANELASAAGVKATGNVRIGKPADEIVSQAQADGADMVVMGSHGHGRIAAAVMGSVATTVIHTGQVPVLVVP